MTKYFSLEVIKKSIKEYNKYRSPESHAKLISIQNHMFTVKFTGSFCRSCGFYDYFEDLIIILEENQVKGEIKQIQEIKEGAIVTYVFRS